jgi:hypothetical protein
MRLFSGFILGVVVTIVAAFVHDTVVTVPPAKPYVNWEVVQESVRQGAEAARAEWDRWTK